MHFLRRLAAPGAAVALLPVLILLSRAFGATWARLTKVVIEP